MTRKRNHLYGFKLLTSLLILFVWNSNALAELTTNELCPVMVDQPVLDDLTLQYGDATIAFCCETCIDEFRDAPEQYVANLTEELKVAVVKEIERRRETEEEVDSSSSRLKGLQRFVAQPIRSPLDWGKRIPAWNFIVLALVFYLLIRATLSASWLAKIPTAAGKHLIAIAGAVCLCLLMFFCLLARTFQFDSSIPPESIAEPQKWQDEMAYHFGLPPRILSGDPARHSLSRRYWRGNDERHPSMERGGNYRTAIFDVSVESDRQILSYGDEAPGYGEILFRIERSPHTPEMLYGPEVIKRAFLSTEFDWQKAPDSVEAVDLVMTEPGRAWEGRYRVKFGTSGMVYLWNVDGKNRPKLHYGIEFSLREDDQRIADRSYVKLGALRVAKPLAQFKMPYDQWLSETPIPELTGENINDPEMLGIPEHAE